MALTREGIRLAEAIYILNKGPVIGELEALFDDRGGIFLVAESAEMSSDCIIQWFARLVVPSLNLNKI